MLLTARSWQQRDNDFIANDCNRIGAIFTLVALVTSCATGLILGDENASCASCATSARAEVAQLVLCASNCGMPTSAFNIRFIYFIMQPM